jgi:hypothetical protein
MTGFVTCPPPVEVENTNHDMFYVAMAPSCQIVIGTGLHESSLRQEEASGCRPTYYILLGA